MRAEVPILRHPAHRIAIVLPLGLLLASVGFDFGYLTTRSLDFAVASYWSLSAGILAALLSVAFGRFDCVSLLQHTCVKNLGPWGCIANAFVVLLFIWSWLLRVENEPPPGDAVVLSVLGVVLALVASWLEAELVRLRMEETSHVPSFLLPVHPRQWNARLWNARQWKNSQH